MKIDNITLVLLAGGDGSRMGFLTSVTPKPLLPVFDGLIIIRQINQAIDAGIKRVVVSVTSEIYSHMKKVLSESNLVGIKVVNNPHHKLDSLSALFYVMKSLSTDKLIMSFGDIFFLENPYKKFLKSVRVNKQCLLGISPPINRSELSSGGIVFLNDKNKVNRIAETPIKNNKNGVRWNGLVCFDAKYKNNLKAFLNKVPRNTPEGDFFEHLIKDNDVLFRGIPGPYFININKPEDLLKASLCRFIELRGNSEIRKLIYKL